MAELMLHHRDGASGLDESLAERLAQPVKTITR
jgi:hypothetical protein